MAAARMFIRHFSFLTAALGVLLFTSGCGSGGKNTTPPPAPAPTISSFTAGAATITTGSSTTLSWTVSSGSSISIDHGVGTVTGTSVSVSPSATTTYTLTATGSGGLTATASVTVTVTAAAPTISSFTAATMTITAGSSTTLSWNVSNGATTSIDHGVGAVTGTSVSVSPSATTTYTLTATGSTGLTATASVAVTVVAAPTVSTFTAAAATITAGTSTTLSWNVSIGTTISIDHGIGTVTGTSVSVTPSATTTYTLTATNAGGTSVTAAVTVTVVAAPTITSFTASATTVTVGSDVTFSWRVSSGATLSIDHNIGTVTGGSYTFKPDTAGQITYTLTAANAAGASVNKTVTLTVLAEPAIASFTASDSLLNPTTTGTKSATLTWSVSDGATVSIDHGVGTVTGNSVLVTPSETMTYTLTASNPAGATASATVSIKVRNKLALLAGKLPPGNTIADMNASCRSFYYVATDSNGNFYVTDWVKNQVCKISPEGAVTLIANGDTGTSNAAKVSLAAHSRMEAAKEAGIERNARSLVTSLSQDTATSSSVSPLIPNAGISGPTGIAVSGDGKAIYVADVGNMVIRKITIEDTGSASISNLTAASVLFFEPTGMVLDTKNNLYGKRPFLAALSVGC